MANLKPIDHQTVRQIRNAHRNDECLGYVIHGPRGCGKTVWSTIVGSQLVGTTDEPKWDHRLKRWITFTPKQYVNMCLDTDDAQIWADWDDAGYWLNRMFWYEPFVREALRFSTLQRTTFSGLMFSTPSLQMLPSKMLEMEDVYRVRIIKERSNEHSPNDKPRRAIVVKPWHSDYKNTGGCSHLYDERFKCWYPDEFFEWYQPVRKLYSTLAKVNMKRAFEKKAGNPMKAQGEEVLEELMASSVIPDYEMVKELTEKIKQYATNLELERIKKENVLKKKRDSVADIELIKKDVEAWSDKELEAEGIDWLKGE
jgi:hypothetical protein